jgi:glycerol uptake facilitator-like aquaporin
MAERLAGGNVALALLANTLSTSATLIALILAFGPVSGAHFNPAVSLAGAWLGGLRWRDAAEYVAAQIVGALGGTFLAHAMFEQDLFQLSTRVRAGGSQMLSEYVATFGLLSVIWGCARKHTGAVPFAVGLYIAGAYWFTASTSFANPAVTIGRIFTDTFAGIRAVDAPGFIGAQLLGAATASVLFRWLLRDLPAGAPDVVIPRAAATR